MGNVVLMNYVLLAEEEMLGDGLVVVDASNGLGKHFGYGENFYLMTLLFEWYGVGYDNLFDGRLLNVVECGTREYTVRSKSSYTFGTLFHHFIGSCGECSCCVDHVIEEYDVLVFYIANDTHFTYDIGAWAVLVADDHRYVEELGVAVGTLRATCVGRSHYHVFESESLDVGDKDGGGVEVVDRNVEEALNLVSMEVHCYDAVDSGSGKKVGNKFGTNGNARLVFAVLASEAEVRNDSVDAGGRGTFGCIYHHEQLK